LKERYGKYNDVSFRKGSMTEVKVIGQVGLHKNVHQATFDLTTGKMIYLNYNMPYYLFKTGLIRASEEMQEIDQKITVGNKMLNNVQIKELALGKEIKISDVMYNGTKCNATVKIKDGQIKKRFIRATLEQAKKPSTTMKRKTQPQKGVKI